MISAIWAMSENRVIGAGNKLPWNVPGDLKHFKEVTWGHPVIMGRKTYDSIGKALPGRKNIVITRSAEFIAKDATVVSSLEEALACVKDVEEVFIVGGAEIYRQALPVIDRVYLTVIHHHFDGDVYCPSEFKEEDYVERSSKLYPGELPYSIKVLDRIVR